MPRCRCHSRRQEHRCCGPWHGGQPAPTPQALMRSRFSAYARGLVDYILVTTDPAGPHYGSDEAAWRAQVQQFCDGTRFDGLRILEAPEPSDDEGFVTFRAELAQAGEDVSFTERSRFLLTDGCWRYHSGERVE